MTDMPDDHIEIRMGIGADEAGDEQDTEKPVPFGEGLDHFVRLGAAVVEDGRTCAVAYHDRSLRTRYLAQGSLVPENGGGSFSGLWPGFR